MSAALDAPPARRALLALAVAFLAGPAQALTCAAPTTVNAYLAARDAEAAFVIVHGRFTPDRAEPRRYTENGVGVAEWRGRLAGTALDTGGFGRAFDAGITFRQACIGGFCLDGLPETPILAVVELALGGPVLATDTCMSRLVPDPSPEALAALETCHRGGACLPVW